MRGTIVEYIPDRLVTIKSAADGQTLRFAADEIASTTLAPPVTPAAEVFGQDDAPVLHVSLVRPARVQLREALATAETPRWKGLEWSAQVERARYRIRCVAPCDLAIDSRHGQRFFFAGDGIPPSRAFSLAGMGPEVHARVRPGSTMRTTAGIIAMPLGIAAAVVGVVFLTNPDPDGERRPEALRAPGIVFSTLGVALIAGGIAMLVTGRTRVRLGPVPPRARAGVSGPRNIHAPVVFH